MDNRNRREALFGYRLRFAPETQPIRQTVIDHVVLRNIRGYGGEPGATTGKLNRLSLAPGQEIALPTEEVRRSLDRLAHQGKIENRRIRRKLHWFLTESGGNELLEAERQGQKIQNNVTRELFGKATLGSDIADFFFDAIGGIFNEITTAYLESLFSKAPSPISPAIVSATIDKLRSSYPSVDTGALRVAIDRFFEEDNPEFQWVQWTFCKNYYSVRAIGLGGNAHILSSELFAGTKFFLDTNVLIDALDGKSPRNLAARQVISSLRRISCEVLVLEITLEELRFLSAYLGENLEVVLNQIPDELLSKTRGLVARAEAAHRADQSQPGAREVLDRYLNAASHVEEELGAELVYSEWFVKNQDSEEVTALAENLKTHYDEANPFRQKTEEAAVHDALALRFISQTDTLEEGRAYFLTRDRSLPGYQPVTLFDGLRVNRAIDLDALMPWLGAITDEDEATAAALASALSNQLIPTSGAFSIQEFRMLAELEMDCRHMPAADVEKCLLYLREEARDLDPARAEDRERLHALVKGFFSSPDRKYIAELQALQSALDVASEKSEKQQEALRQQEKSNEQLQLKIKQIALQRKVGRRLVAATAVLVVMLLGSFFVAQEFASGENWLQKLGDSWWLIALSFSLSIALARWLCRGELWPVAKKYLHPFRAML